MAFDLEMRRGGSFVGSFRTVVVIAALCAGLAATRGRAGVPTYVGVGGDTCDTATVVPVSVGPLGQPLSVVIEGDNTSASGPDCGIQAPDPLWWEAFSLDVCARVSISLCGTSPLQRPSYAILFDECPCGDRLRPDVAGRGSPGCDDENVWMIFDALPAGTYYYPVYADEQVLLNGLGPYVITITAETCLGSCCNAIDGTCIENVTQTSCVGPVDDWNPGRTCCEAECRLPGDEFAARDVILLSRVPLEDFPGGSASANDIWGYVSPSGREYAIVGLHDGTGFVDITDPSSPDVLADISDAPSVWSDVAVFDEYAYNVNEGGGGVQVFDLTQIDDGVVTLVDSFTGSGLQTAHNVFVNPASGYAYLCGANLASGGLVALDLSDPAHPVLAGAWSERYVHDTFVVSYEDGPYAGREIAFNFCGSLGVKLVDVTNKSDMFTITTVGYPNLTYTHQGWLDDARRYLYVDDELDERQDPGTATTTTYVLDVSDISSPTFVTSFTNGVCAADHNLIARGGYVYEANYTSGLRIYDVSDVLSATEVGYFDTHAEGNAPSFDGAWGVFAGFPSGVLIVSDIQRGLFVLNYDCNENGVADVTDIADGTSVDCDANGLPDECTYLIDGDLDRNRRRDAEDQAVFTSCLSGPVLPGFRGSPAYAAPCCVHADGDRDGDVDLRDLHSLLEALSR